MEQYTQGAGGGSGLPEVTMAPMPPMQKIGKWKASNMVARASWELLKKDKEMLLFPVLSAVVSLFVLGIGAGLYYSLEKGGVLPEGAAQGPLLSYGLLFVTYFFSFFVVIFFQTGVVALVAGRVNGQDLTFADGLRVSFSHIGKIAAWALLSATIGLILRMIAERSRLLGKIVTAILGAAWGVATFFIVPVLILENGSVFDSLHSSVAIVKKTWGESLIVNIGASMIFTLLGLFGVTLFALSFFTGNFGIIFSVGITLVLFLVLLSIVSSTLNVIFRVVLYGYAKSGQAPEGFSPELMQMAFRAK